MAFVIPGGVPGIYVFLILIIKDVEARDKAIR